MRDLNFIYASINDEEAAMRFLQKMHDNKMLYLFDSEPEEIEKVAVEVTKSLTDEQCITMRLRIHELFTVMRGEDISAYCLRMLPQR